MTSRPSLDDIVGDLSAEHADLDRILSAGLPPADALRAIVVDVIASTTDRTFIIRIRNGTTEWIDVKTGLASGPLTEVFGDLRPG